MKYFFQVAARLGLQNNIDQQIDGRIEYNEYMRQLINENHPIWITGQAIKHFIGRGNELPDMAEQKQPNNGQGDSCQSVFPSSAHNIVTPSELHAVCQRHGSLLSFPAGGQANF